MPGAILLLEYLRKAFAGADRKITIDDFDGSLTIDLRLNEHLQSQIFWYGYYSRDIVMTMDRILTPGMVVFDVGANIGEISLCAARRVGSEGGVYSFDAYASGANAEQILDYLKNLDYSFFTTRKKGKAVCFTA